MTLDRSDLCIACGMPMKDASQHASGDPGKAWCLHCALPDGSMKSYGEKAADLAAFIVRTQGLDLEAAKAAAKALMARLPAWKDRT